MKLLLIITQMASLLTFGFSCSIKNSESVENFRIGHGKTSKQILEKANDYYEADDFEKALQYFDALIELDPGAEGEIYYKRAYCNALLLNLDESTRDYLTAAELNYRKGDAYYNAGVNQTLKVNDSLAITLFRKSLEFQPNDSTTLNEIRLAKERLRSINEFWSDEKN